MTKHIDFILNDYGYRKIIFRFYPRCTYVHGFHDDPPKTWKDVYKVYYSWAILVKYYDSEKEVLEQSKVLFSMPCDECSMVPNIDGAIEYLEKKTIKKKEKTVTLTAFGQPAADWDISKHKYTDWDNNEHIYYVFQVFNNFTGQGYKFDLSEDKCNDFKEYMKRINEYALAHGEGI